MTVYRPYTSLINPILFVIWTALSFFAHNFARHALGAVRESQLNDAEGSSTDESQVMWFAIFLLTLFQIGIGGVILTQFETLLRFFSSLKNGRPQLLPIALEPLPEKGPVVLLEPDCSKMMPFQTQITLALTHLIATLTTNASIAFATPAPAFAIKAFEPVTTALLAALVSGKRIETRVIIALPLVAIGAIGFAWRSDFMMGNLFGILMAFISNVTYGLRNISVKSALESCRDSSRRTHTQILAQMSVSSTVLLVWVVLIQATSTPNAARYFLGNTNALLCSLYSGLFHVSYTLISVVVMLAVLSVVAHATANLGKRVIVSLLFYAIGWQLPSVVNIIFGLIFLAGLLVYVRSNKLIHMSESQDFQTLVLTIICTLFVLVCAFCPNLGGPLKVSSSHSSALINKSAFLQPHDKAGGSITFLPINEANADILYPKFSSALNRLEENFPNVDLFKEPERADWLSRQLTEQSDVVLEAQRIHYQLFSRILRGSNRAILINVEKTEEGSTAAPGRHLVSLAVRQFIAVQFGLSLKMTCSLDDCRFEEIVRTNDLVVFVNCGGDILQSVEKLSKIFKNFPDNRIVVLPTSVANGNQPDAFRTLRVICSNRNDVTILLRDRISFEAAKKVLTNVKIYLAPDLSMAMGTQRLTITPHYEMALALVGNDWEATVDEKLPKNVSTIYWEKDNLLNFGNLSDTFELEELETMSALSFLARGRTVVTDRIEAHFLALLLGRPTVFIAKDGTLNSGSYIDTWERSLKSTTVANSFDDALNAVRIVCNKNNVKAF